jgi:hypothetical protein
MKLKDFLSSINYDKKALLDGDENAKKLYPAFVVNKCLSYFSDTIFHSNEMNCVPWLDNKSQFDYYRLGVRKKKRFSPWLKKEIEENISIIKQVYGYTDSKAQEVLNILGPEDIKNLKTYLEKGGPKN